MSRKEVKTLLIFFDIQYGKRTPTAQLRLALLANIRTVLTSSTERLENNSSKYKTFEKHFNAVARPVGLYILKFAAAYLCWAVMWVLVGKFWQHWNVIIPKDTFWKQFLHVLNHPFYSDETLEGEVGRRLDYRGDNAESYAMWFINFLGADILGEAGKAAGYKSIQVAGLMKNIFDNIRNSGVMPNLSWNGLISTFGRARFVKFCASVIFFASRIFGTEVVELTLEIYAGVADPSETLRVLNIPSLADFASHVPTPSEELYAEVKSKCAARNPCHSRDNLCRYDASRKKCRPSALSYHRYKPSSASPAA